MGRIFLQKTGNSRRLAATPRPIGGREVNPDAPAYGPKTMTHGAL